MTDPMRAAGPFPIDHVEVRFVTFYADVRGATRHQNRHTDRSRSIHLRARPASDAELTWGLAGGRPHGIAPFPIIVRCLALVGKVEWQIRPVVHLVGTNPERGVQQEANRNTH